MKPRNWLITTGVAVAYLLVFGPTLVHLLADWSTNGEYGHGFLLVPLAVYLAWSRRTDAAAPAPILGIAAVVASVALYLAGTVAAEYFTRRLSALLALAGLTLFFRGTLQLKAWWLPYMMALFTIPLPEVVLNSVTLPLQLFASRVAVSMLQFRHVPATLAGNIIQLPGRDLFVAEACSGLRSLSALLGLTLLLAGTQLKRPLSRAVLLALAVPAALLANAFRVFATGFAAYYAGPAVAEGTLHDLAGIAVFAVALGIVGLAAVALRFVERRRGAPVAVDPGQPSGSTASLTPRLALAFAPAAVLLMGAAAAATIEPERSLPLITPLAGFPAQLAGYVASGDRRIDDAVLRVLAPDDYLHRSYGHADGEVGFTLFVAYYGRQLGGASIHSPRNCLPGSGWEPVQHERLRIATPYGESPVNRYVVEHESGARALVYYWYQGRGRVEANEYSVKWQLLRDGMARRRTDEALVRLVFPLARGQTGADALTRRVLEETVASLRGHLPS
jgi:exosortase D (VPLPA-CTERM-specific)